MTPQQARTVLLRYNEWWRWENPDPFAEPRIEGPEMPPPREIGIAIDEACHALAVNAAAMETLRRIADGDNRTRRKKLASACVRFLDALDVAK